MTTKLCERPFPTSFWCWIYRVALSIEQRPSWRTTSPGKFDCLITDVSMPGCSGLDLLQRLRSIGSSMPVIIITADTSPTTRSRAMRSGAHAYLTKPVSSEALYHHLQSALRREGSPPDGDGRETPSDG